MVNFKIDNLKNMNLELRAFAEFLRSENITDDDIFASRLVSCELISNVIRHSGEAAEFTGKLLGDAIEITVSAQSLSGVSLEANLPDVFAESGRGLFIIQSVCGGNIEQVNGAVRVLIKKH